MVGTDNMNIETVIIEFTTRGYTDIVDITENVQSVLSSSGFQEGTCTLFAIGSTTGLTTIEYEPGLVKQDLAAMFDHFAPYGRPYAHNLTWGDDNGASHLRSSLMGTDLSIPFNGGELILGTWQQIVFVDFDTRPRKRRVVIQLMGK